MRLVSVLGMVGLLFASAAHGSPAIRSAGDIGPEDLPRIQVVSSSSAGIVLSFELPALGVEEMTADGRTFQIVSIPGGGLSGDVGTPGIPEFARLLSIPDEVGASVTATAEDETELTGYTLMPVQADEGEGFAYDAAAYARAGYGDEPAAAAGRPAISRDLRVIPLTFRPVRYDPSRGVLKVAGRIRVEVRFGGSDPQSARPIHRNVISPSFDRLYRELVVNYEGPPAGARVEPGTYLVICVNNADVTSRLQPLLDWRKRMGMPVRLATTAETGSTKESIKAFIQNAYDTWENPPEYVCIVGDASGGYPIPTFHENNTYYHGEGDHEYTLLAGGDVLSDLNVGRLSFSSLTELDTEVAKIVGYESRPYTQDPSWFKRACLVGDPYQSGISCVQVQQWIKCRLRNIGYTQIDTVFSGNFVSGMTTALNRGDTVFSYRGYYQMSGWGNSNTNALSNGWKLPFVVAITCDTGSFESDGSCRTEGFLRAGTPSLPRGGIGAIGTATTGTHTRFNNCIHVGIFYGLLYAGHTTMGSALTRGKYELYLNYWTVDPNRVYTWSTWNNLMGDPAVDIFLDEPVQIVADAPESVPVGTNAVTVVAHDDLGAPIPGALVCLSKGTETYSTGYTGEDGSIELPVSLATSGTMQLTITRHDNVPLLGDIAVTDPQRFVAYRSSTIDDDSAGESAGNADGIVNPAERIELPVEVRNFGSELAGGVAGILSTADPYASVLADSQSFGDVDAGASAWSAGSYVISVRPDCPDRHVIRLSLDLSSGTDAWHSIIDLPVVSADLVADGATVLGDGRIDPGDENPITVRLKNLGGASAVDPTAMIVSMSELIDVPDRIGAYTTIDPDGENENITDTFTIHASPSCYNGYVANLKVILTFSGGLSDTTYVQVPVGVRTANDPVGPDAYGYMAYDDSDLSYPQRPMYQWVELDPAQGGSGGTEIVLGDYGDQQDKSRVIDVPFAFGFYGRSFTRATVCSNGWIVMGTTYLTDYRNWSLPSGDAPDNIVAVFWDEIYQQNGISKAFQRYDAAQHRWIVEWSKFKSLTYPNSYETFEAIFYDPAYYPTDTGDGKILMQYKEVANIDGTDGYATVGMQNADHTAGICYTYFNQYAPGANQLRGNRAILFVPHTETLTGVEGGAAAAPRFALRQNLPNPFNPRTVIRYSLEASGAASLTVFDVAGRAVRRLVQGTAAAGEHAVVWDGRDDAGRAVPSGIYLYRLDADRRSETKKMILVQ